MSLEKEQITRILETLSHSKFRSRFHLAVREKQYIDEKGIDIIKQHAYDFVSKRLAPSEIPNDGKQTPMRGHPVFLAQHATATCCRECLAKWHKIPVGRGLTIREQEYVVNIIMAWIEREYQN